MELENRQAADILLTNAVVLTMDDQLTLYEPGAVAIRGDQILAVGKEADLLASIQATQVPDCV